MVAIELPLQTRTEFEFGAFYRARVVYLNGADVVGTDAQQLIANAAVLKTQYSHPAHLHFRLERDGVVTAGDVSERSDAEDGNQAMGFRGMKIVPYFSESERSAFDALVDSGQVSVRQKSLDDLLAEDASLALTIARDSFTLPDGSSLPLTRLRYVSHRFDAAWTRETTFVAEYGGATS